MGAKSILITGCSSGIGLAAAISLKERGHLVFATARKAADVLRLKSFGLQSLALDIDDTSSMKHALQHILQQTGGTLDAIFNNAGYVQIGAIEDLNREIDRAQFETNVFGPMELTRLVLPIMRKQGHGRIIQNCSILGIVASPLCGSYNGSKFALEGFSNTLRLELHGTNINVSIICPGPIMTKWRANAHQQFQHSLTHPEVSAYADVYKKLEKTYFNADSKNKLALSPDVVTKKLIHALESKHPKAHYYIGLPSLFMSWSRRVLPDWALDWLILRTSSMSKYSRY